MNVLNRIVMVVLYLSLIVASVSLIVLAWSIPNDSIDGLRDAVDWLDRNDGDLEKALLTTVASLVGLLAFIVILLELLPQSGADVKMTDLTVGDAVLSTAAISQRIEEAVGQVPHVAQVRATVRPKRKGVKVALDLHVTPDANLATVTDEACEAARDVLQNRVHVALVEAPRARIHYRELRMQRAAQARGRPTAAARPAAPPVAEAPAPPTAATTPEPAPAPDARAGDGAEGGAKQSASEAEPQVEAEKPAGEDEPEASVERKAE